MGKLWCQWQTIFGGSKITADGDCSYEIKRRLLLGRKAITNPDNLLKSRDITLLTIGRTDAKAETLILWPSDVKDWLIWKDSDAGEDWRREKGMTEDEMDGWHHRLSGHEFEWALGTGDGQGGLACCSPEAHKESDMNEQLNWTELICNQAGVLSSLV